MSTGTPVPEGFWRAYIDEARTRHSGHRALEARTGGNFADQEALGQGQSFEYTLRLLEKRWGEYPWQQTPPWPEFLSAVLTRMHETEAGDTPGTP